jgi:hypothetical protein
MMMMMMTNLSSVLNVHGRHDLRLDVGEVPGKVVALQLLTQLLSRRHVSNVCLKQSNKKTVNKIGKC